MLVLAKQKFKPIKQLIHNITSWNTEGSKKEISYYLKDETNYKMINFVKETIKSLVLFLSKYGFQRSRI